MATQTRARTAGQQDELMKAPAGSHSPTHGQPGTPRRAAWQKPMASAAALVAVVCCGGDGGSGCQRIDIAETYPAHASNVGGETLEEAARLQIMQGALEFLSTQLGTILQSVLPSEDGRILLFPDESVLGEQGAGIALRDGCIGEANDDGSCDAPVGRSELSIPISTLNENVTLSWLPNDARGRPGLRFELHDAPLHSDLILAMDIAQLQTSATCRLTGEDDRAAIRVAGIGFDFRLNVHASGGPLRIGGAVENIEVDLGPHSNAWLSGMTAVACDDTHNALPCSDPTCFEPGANCADVCGLLDSLVGELAGVVAGVLTPALEVLGPTLASAVTSALFSDIEGTRLEFGFSLSPEAVFGSLFSNAAPLLAAIVGSAPPTLVGIDDEPDQNATQEPPPDGGGSGAAPHRSRPPPSAGIATGFNVGTTSDPAACARGVPPPDYSGLLGPPPTYSGFVQVPRADGASRPERYHLAVSLSQAVLSQATWSLFQSGITCFALDSEAMASLAGPSISMTAGLLMSLDARLDGLTEPESPLYVSVRAQHAPVARLGASRSIAPGVHEPLLELTIDDLELGIYVFIDDQQQRLTGITADLTLHLGIERSPQQTLELVVREVAVSDTRQSYNELAPTADLSNLLPLIVELVVGNILGDGAGFGLDMSSVLEDALGFPIEVRLNAVRRDFGTTGVPHLSIYATLCSKPQVDDPNHPICYAPSSVPLVAPRTAPSDAATPALVAATVPLPATGLPPPAGASPGALTVRVAQAHGLYHEISDAQRFPPQRWLAMPSGEVWLHVERADGSALGDAAGANEGAATLPMPQDLEFQYRVDGGAWSAFVRPTEHGKLHVHSARLRIVGAHEIDLRQRLAGQYMTRSPDVTTLSVWVDPERPTLYLTPNRMGDSVSLSGADLGTPPDWLTFWARPAERLADPQTGWQPVPEATLTAAQHPGIWQVIARDLAGNPSAVATVALAANDPTPANTTDSETAPQQVSDALAQRAEGCASIRPGIEGGPSAALGLALTCWLLAVRRRKGATPPR